MKLWKQNSSVFVPSAVDIAHLKKVRGRNGYDLMSSEQKLSLVRAVRTETDKIITNMMGK